MTVLNELLDHSKEWSVKLKEIRQKFLREWEEILQERPFVQSEKLHEEVLEELLLLLEKLNFRNIPKFKEAHNESVEERIKRLLKGNRFENFDLKYENIIQEFTRESLQSLDTLWLKSDRSTPQFMRESEHVCSHSLSKLKVLLDNPALEYSSFGRDEEKIVKEKWHQAINKLHILQAERVFHLHDLETDTEKVMSALRCMQEKHMLISIESQESASDILRHLQSNLLKQENNIVNIERSLQVLCDLWNEQAQLQSCLKQLLEKESKSCVAGKIVSSAINSLALSLGALAGDFFAPLSIRHLEGSLWHISNSIYESIAHAKKKRKYFLSQVKTSCNRFLVNFSHQIENCLGRSVRVIKQHSQERKLAQTDRLYTSSENSISVVEKECSHRIEEEISAVTKLDEYHAFLMNNGREVSALLN